MSAITLRPPNDDPDRGGLLFGLLNEHLLPQPDAAEPMSRPATLFAQSVEAPDEGFFWRFWADVFGIAEQIPHGHPAQDRLAAFVRELTLVPDTGRKVWEARVWTDLPLLGAAVREHLDRPATDEAKVSFHAFVARLLQAGVSPGAETTAIWMLRDALESTAGDVDVDGALKTAAVYIEYAGAALVQKLALQPAEPEPELDPAQQRLLKGGELWGGKSGLTVDRWTFWGRRFREQAEKAKGRDAKDLALHAARLIEVWAQTRLST